MHHHGSLHLHAEYRSVPSTSPPSANLHLESTTQSFATANLNRISGLASPEVISSLISSLTAISAPSERLQDAHINASVFSHKTDPMLGAQEPVLSNSQPPQGATSPQLPIPNELEMKTTKVENTIQSPMELERPQATTSLLLSPSTLSPQKSESSIKSQDDTVSVGNQSIEQPLRSSASSLASSLNNAGASGVVLSEHVNGVSRSRVQESAVLGLDNKEYVRSTGSKQDFVYSKENTPSPQKPRPLSLLQFKAPHSPSLGPVGHESSQSAIGNHLIPSRHSSLRYSLSERPRSRDSKRLSTSSRDLKDLNIDQDLIEEEHSTVRRIRELQEAKERRHNEWRREARKSERRKHTSMPSPSSTYKPLAHQGSPPVVGILVEVPDKDVQRVKEEAVSKNQSTTIQSQANSAPGPNRRPSVTSTVSPSLINPADAPPVLKGVKHRRVPSGLKKSTTSGSMSLDPSESALMAIEDEVESFLASPRLTQRIRHPRTGRVIAFSEVGDPKGFPVICCVGMGLTRYVTAFYDDLAKSLKLRLITPDRPGIGESEAYPDGKGTPLGWADDIYVLCSTLEITRFSLLAHSAGAVYALAIALRLTQYVRGRIHLLAPWMPPSQLNSMSALKGPIVPAEMPFGQKLLSILPTSFLKVANANFMTATSASISPRTRSKRKSAIASSDHDRRTSMYSETRPPDPPKLTRVSCYQATTASLMKSGVINSPPTSPPQTATSQLRPMSEGPSSLPSTAPGISPERRHALYNEILTHRIWELATTHANPAVDLVVCLERRTPIGFKYTDVTRAVVVHHGARDTRVPVENIRLLERNMPRCELRILPDEGHGLMASASVMSSVLGEMEKEWTEYERVVRKGSGQLWSIDR